MNTIIEQVLHGDLSMDDFLRMLQHDCCLQKYISRIIPDAAKSNPDHTFWRIVPFDTLKRNNFDYYKFLFWGNNSSNKFGTNLTLYNRLSKAYRFYYPETPCTNKYQEEFDIYLDVIKDCYDGPEVRSIVEGIISELLQFRTKSQRVKQGNALISERFHLGQGKRPRWIQGPEWPMGKNSPMMFIRQQRDGENVIYEFCDVDTKETRVVRQYY